MANVHLIERDNNLQRIDAAQRRWESGDWRISDDLIKQLIGGRLYLHSAQNEPSHFGGTITGFRDVIDSNGNVRRVIEFVFDEESRGVLRPNGWGNHISVDM